MNERSAGGAAVAAGELITFLDDDDELRPYALAELLRRHQSLPRSDFLWGGRLVHEMDASDRFIATREDDWSRLPDTLEGTTFLPFVLKIATNSAFTIRRTVFDALGGFDEKLRVSEDRDTLHRSSRAAATPARPCPRPSSMSTKAIPV